MNEVTGPIHILVDADACPVKEEIYKVCFRLDLPVTIVANSYLRVPEHPLVQRVVVGSGMDAADDYIAGKANSASVVITADILLAERCLKAGASVIAPDGKTFDHNSIGSAVAMRSVMEELRAGGDQVGRNAPFTKADRSRFLSTMDTVLTRLMRKN
ncbi:MAG: YaiI/YqxD family protein [Pseudomonadota bacterium]